MQNRYFIYYIRVNSYIANEISNILYLIPELVYKIHPI